LDFVQDLPETERGHKHIFTAIDYATRWIIAIPCANRTANTVTRLLYEHIVCTFGAPDELITDRGSCFLNDGVKGLTELLRINHFASTSYHPQTNGMVERMHRVLEHAITTLTQAQPLLWDRFLAQSVFALRTRTHTVTGESPFFLVYGVEPRIPGERLTGQHDRDGLMPGPPQFNLRYETVEGRAEDVELRRQHLLTDLAERRGQAYDRSMRQAERMAARDTREPEDEVVEGYHYQVNDWVKLKNMERNKFEFRWIGPYHIQRLGNHPRSYYVQDGRGQIRPHPVAETNLAPWLADLQDNEEYSFYGHRQSTDQEERTEAVEMNATREEVLDSQFLPELMEPSRIEPPSELVISDEEELPAHLRNGDWRIRRPPNVQPRVLKRRKHNPIDTEENSTSSMEISVEQTNCGTPEIIEISDEEDYLEFTNRRDSIDSDSRGEMLQSSLLYFEVDHEDPNHEATLSLGSTMGSTEALLNETVPSNESMRFLYNDKSLNNAMTIIKADTMM
jgi:hypothetical protein